MAAELGMPQIDWRKPALAKQLLELGESDPVKIDWKAALRHSVPH